jgi:hypothetical protein
MAFVKKMKAGAASRDAQRAASEGHSVFVYKFDMPNLNSLVSSTVSGASEAIEEIESAGWTMSQMALHPGVRHGSLVMLFRREPTDPIPQG